MISWIHIEDLCRMIHFALKNEPMKGVFNAVAPQPESNAAFMRTLAAVRNGSWYVAVHIPSLLLKIIMGEMSIEVLKSATVSAEKIRSAGFVFSFPSLKDALRDLIGR
jgi:NAD dependent epimerase/dehydratase family enzyme